MSATILFVDDEPDLEVLVLQKFRRQIRDGEVTILFARDGLEALASLEQNPHVDMVVSDINMPRMDGLSLLAKLQEAEDKKSTIIVSAYGDMSNIRTAMNRGAFDFLTKPIDFADLEATIGKTIRHIEMLREVRRRQIEAERAHAALSRHFSPELAKRLAAGGEGEGIEVQWRDVATIFTDITGFTSLVETAPPEALGKLLNEYVGGMTDVVFAHEGTVAKIIGDAIQVLFNAPGDQPDYATRAVACAHELDAWAQDFRARQSAMGVAFGATRIGIHAGPALVGNFANVTSISYGTMVAGNAGFTTYSLWFTPLTAGTLQLSFSTTSADNIGPLLDNVSVVAVPEPAAWGMMIGGFGLAGMAMRRRVPKTKISFA